MLLRKYEMPWRRAYEAYAGLAWTIAFVFFIFAAVRSIVPWPLTAGLALLCMMLAFHRSGQALGVLTVRASLCGRAMAFITPNALRKLCADPKQVFLGFGFEWQPVHSQRLYELAKVNFRDFVVSPCCFGSWATRSIRSPMKKSDSPISMASKRKSVPFIARL